MSYNKVIIIGYLGSNPEVREYDGRKVANFSVATSERWKDRTGNTQEHTEWFRVSFWGNTAEVVEKYLKKGSQVYIEGRLRTREYISSEGKTRTSLEIAGQSLQMLSNREDGMNNNNNYSSNSNTTTKVDGSKEEFKSEQEESGEDLPF